MYMGARRDTRRFLAPAIRAWLPASAVAWGVYGQEKESRNRLLYGLVR